MANEPVGTVVCGWCGEVSEIRKNSKQKYYVYCPSCGINQPALPAFQNIIINRGEFYPEELEWVRKLAAYKPKVEPLPQPEITPEPEPEKLKQSEPKKLKQSEVPPKEPQKLTGLAKSFSNFLGAEG